MSATMQCIGLVKKNLDTHSRNRHKIYLYNENILIPSGKFPSIRRLFLPARLSLMTQLLIIWVKNSKTFHICGKIGLLIVPA